MSSFVVELKLLRLAVHRCLPGDKSSSDEITPLIEAAKWNHVLWLGRKHRVLLLLRAALQRPSSPCPVHIRAQLDALYAAAQMQLLARAAEIARLQDHFEKKQLPLVLADDWMFLQCFASGEPLGETRTAIRCVVHPHDKLRAEEAIARAEHPIAQGQFQVAARGQTPVEIIEIDKPLVIESTLSLGRHALPRMANSHWWPLLRASPGPRDLFREWQWQVLAQPLSAPPAELSSAVSDAGIPSLRNAPAGVSTLPSAPFVPTPETVAERMLTLAGTEPGDTVCDLGSGDGTVVITAAKTFGARAIGIERDPQLVAEATTRANAAGLGDRTSFLCADLFAADLSAVTVICLYLLPAYYEPVRQQLLRHARPGTRVVSHDYYFPDWPPDQTELVRCGPAQVAQIYLWRVGKNPTA
jgi:predicted O-methyltransferase YrrM